MLDPTGFTLGEGGMARPSRGVRAPLDRVPGMAGRRSGTGLAMTGMGLGDVPCAAADGSRDGVDILCSVSRSPLDDIERYKAHMHTVGTADKHTGQKREI